MGAPLAGSSLRASVNTGGGLRLRGLKPAIRSRRLQMIFPLKGAERRGLVSLEAKKRKVGIEIMDLLHVKGCALGICGTVGRMWSNAS